MSGIVRETGSERGRKTKKECNQNKKEREEECKNRRKSFTRGLREKERNNPT
jgi:hypothetical protein